METLKLYLPRSISPRRLVLTLSVLALGIWLRADLPAAIAFALKQLLFISPLIALAMVVTAWLMATGAVNRLAELFAGRAWRTIAIVSLVGALTPVCGVTVLPLVAGLLSAGVPIAPIMAFLLSSPITSPEMLAITAGILGWPFAIGKSLAAFGIGLVGGAVTLVLVRAGLFHAPVRNVGRLRELAGSDCCASPSELNWRFWREAPRRLVFKRSFWATTRLAVRWLTIAFFAEYFLRRYLPPELLAGYVGNDSTWAVPLAATIGAPIYLDGYAALPLIRALLEKGMADGPAMAFLVAGGITSAWAAIPVFALLRNGLFSYYLLMAVFCSMLAGWGFGLF